MPIVDVQTDNDALTMTITAHYDAVVDRVWQLWADPRLLERWWGPPSHPATFVEHDLTPRGKASYYMNAPNGARYHGWWRFVAIEAPARLEFEDGFADEAGNPSDELPTTRTIVSIAGRDDGKAVMTMRTHFPSAEEMKQLLDMGVEQGIRDALGQADALLAEHARPD